MLVKKCFAQFEGMDSIEPIVDSTDHSFLNVLQKALLLALRECGELSIMQLRNAEEQMKAFIQGKCSE